LDRGSPGAASVRILSRRKLREFWTARPESMVPLDRWYRTAKRARWATFADVRRTFGSADLVGDYVVFNVGGNKYRIIAAFHFDRGFLYVRHVLTHADYDKGGWKDG